MKKPLRKIRSYVRREGRITSAQKKALEELYPKYGIDLQECIGGPTCPPNIVEIVGTSRDLSVHQSCETDIVCEIGFGMGDSLIQMAKDHPETNFLGIDVYAPGVGSVLRTIELEGLTNVRLIHGDAVEVLENHLPDNSLSRVHIYYPDPWPKKRHHKRRLIQSSFVELIAKKLKPHGILHTVTDDDGYAEHILSAVDNAIWHRLASSGPVFIRPSTKFERRAIRLGHKIHEFWFENI